MPVQILSDAEREAWSRFPERIEEDALGAFFTLTASESEAIRRLYGDQNRLAVALQVCSLRWLGFIPDDLWSAPGRAVSYLAEQLDVAAEVLTDYRALPRTRSEHARVAQRIARFRTTIGNDLGRLHWRLLQAALEHDSPLALLREACRWLRSEQIARPGLTVLERTGVRRSDGRRARDPSRACAHARRGPGAAAGGALAGGCGALAAGTGDDPLGMAGAGRQVGLARGARPDREAGVPARYGCRRLGSVGVEPEPPSVSGAARAPVDQPGAAAPPRAGPPSGAGRVLRRSGGEGNRRGRGPVR